MILSYSFFRGWLYLLNISFEVIMDLKTNEKILTFDNHNRENYKITRLPLWLT